MAAKRTGRPFTRTEALQAHKATEAQTYQDKEYLAPRKAAERLNVSTTTLQKWTDTATGGCPWLNGKAIRTRQLPTAYARHITYYLVEDLERVIDATVQGGGTARRVRPAEAEVHRRDGSDPRRRRAAVALLTGRRRTRHWFVADRPVC